MPGIDYPVEYEYPDGRKVLLLDVEAVELGFCPGCGSFVAGVESDDLSLGQFGMCGECVEGGTEIKQANTTTSTMISSINGGAANSQPVLFTYLQGAYSAG